MTASLPTDSAPLIVRTYDTCGLSAVALSVARRTADDILKDVGIAVVWRPCEVLESQTACGAALASTEVIVRTIPATHEIGHLLLGTAIHSDRGLMRPFWTKAELKSNRRVDWSFSGREAAPIRQGLAWRAGR
jgi:hypothetical protein